MEKITVRKKVFWNAAGKMMSGTVKQIFSTHALVAAGDCDYIVQKSNLRAVPKGVGRIASLLLAAAKALGVIGFVFTFSAKPGKKKMSLKWIDPEGSTLANMPCTSPEIAEADRAFKAGQTDIVTEINPELMKRKEPRAAPLKIEPKVTTVSPVAPQKVEEQNLPPQQIGLR